ncbi:chitobiase/beta-hexosaminidase C-terminal domain-containing protein [Lederbergia wuyishanensis]|uniref:Aryl-phospho-beta-D-glucosidase BglC (GH1 family) n=1 Tax=Lederbergia wuyishanensis TaxID=1347903 RepID=A0ABU0D5T3_9BACI|nr:chitobiase/beta-hexosaminidase C-terminal domain-containing protein [Lederbergia wuyishanensis]MCJ8008363.1 chitobiase/beta-hexosaminidase C-terminal domain-containing protein [Lederbergia wuyishanensis]MDQ0343777.1 aryl-phospho-beta-D-glucosidase BglC (GH1 family) [Lederbergia wuyishanensis]
MRKYAKVFSIAVIVALVMTMLPNHQQAKIPDDAIMFQDFEGSEALFKAAQGATGALSMEEAYEGKQSLKYEVLSSGDPSVSKASISIKSMGKPIDATGMEYFVFYIKDTQGANTIKIALTDSSGKSTDFGWKAMNTKKNEWVRYEVPMSSFAGIDFSSISEVRIGQWNEGIYYIDQLFFAKSLPPIPPDQPTAYHPSGEYDNFVVVELRTYSVGTDIYYTTDGTLPTKESSLYKGPLRLESNTTLKAVAYNPKGDIYSEVSTFDYVIHQKEDLAKPIAYPAAGTYVVPQSIELSAVEDATIYYTTDGKIPTTSSKKYSQPIKVSKDTVIKAIAVKDQLQSEVAVNQYTIDKNPTAFLKTDGKKMRNNYGSGDEVILRGTNAGGWLVMESWMSPTNSPDQKTTIKTLTDRFGEKTAWELIKLYQDNYWTEVDFDNIKEAGMNTVRLPFSYFEMLNGDGSLKATAFDRMDWFIEEAAKRELYVILDMHGAPGSQNGKDHSGDTDRPDKGNLFGNKENMDKTVFLWGKIAERYKDEKWVAGYDLLNEPGGATGIEQFDFYDQLYKAVRAKDKNHMMFIEAIWEPYHLPKPDLYGWENVVYSYHFYGWDNIDSFTSQKRFTDSKIPMVNEMTNYNVPLLVGEFTLFNNLQSWDYALKVYEEQGWSFTTWSYKVTGEGSSWGMYTGNPPKVNIQRDSEEEIRSKWSLVGTDTSFKRNDSFVDIIRNYANPDFRNSDERTWVANFEGLDEDTTFETGSLATASLDFENKANGDASLKLVIDDSGNKDATRQYVSIKTSVNFADDSSTYPKYLLFDVFNGTKKESTITVTLIDKNGNQATAKTHTATKALSNAWSRVPLLLKSISGDIDKSSIVEIRLAMEDPGTYNFDNIFVGQSFSNNLPAELDFHTVRGLVEKANIQLEGIRNALLVQLDNAERDFEKASALMKQGKEKQAEQARKSGYSTLESLTDFVSKHSGKHIPKENAEKIIWALEHVYFY